MTQPAKRPSFKSWALIAALIVIATPAVANAWWKDDWPYRKQVSVDTSPKGAAIGEPIGRAPVLVRLHSGNFSFSDSQDGGADLRVVAADDKTPLAYHLESFDPVLGVAAVWIDVPEMPVGAAKPLWLYYGNKKATDASNTAATFDADYTLVLHFSDAAGKPVRDATAYGNNAITGPAGVDEGSIIGKGGRFLGAGPVVVPPSTSLAITPGGAFSFSAWVKSAGPQSRAALYVRRDGLGSLAVGLDQNTPFVEVGGQRIAAAQAIQPGQWTHIAVTADGKTVTLYVNGASAGSAQTALPALNTATAFGADVNPTGGLTAFIGSMDEIRLSKVARPAGLIHADALGQGSESKLVQYGTDEKKSGFGFGYFGIIVQHVTIDAWTVIAILGLLAALSWYVMWTKGSYVSAVDAANRVFVNVYRDSGGDLFKLDDRLGHLNAGLQRRIGRSSIYRVFKVGSDEVMRRAEGGRQVVLTAEAIEVVRAVMDGTLVRENQGLSKNMVFLTIAISGGPFLGLLGTVVGVMITFAAIAASGDVNINAIAPGISAALLATVAGLAVAIPALFGYNYILIRNRNVTADMQVFIDEFVTRISEVHHERNYAAAAE